MGRNTPVRVMHFIHSLEKGGAEHQLAYLIKHTQPGSLSHAVCCFDDQGGEELASRCDLFKLDRKGKYDFKHREISRLLSSWKPEIVHNWLPNLLANSYLPARRYGKAVFLASYRSAVRLNSLYRALQALVYLRCDALVSNLPSASMFFPFRQIFTSKRGAFIPNGIPLAAISRADPGLPGGIRTAPDDFLLLFVGRLSPEKNLPLLLEGLGRLSSRAERLKLVICGEGRAGDQIRDQARGLGIEGRVYFLGYQEDIYPIMKTCDLLVLPSSREGMPNVLFEALAAGLPAIASRIPTHQYWFEDRGFVSLFDPHSIAGIAASIEREMDRTEDEKIQRREEARLFVSEMDIPVMVEKYEDFYRGLLE